MKSNMKDIVRDIMFTLIILVLGYLKLFLLPQLYLFAGGGVEQEINLWKFTIYTTLGTFCILYLIVTKWIRFFVRGEPDVDWINSVGHDPEDTFLSKIPILQTIINNLVLLWLISLIITIPLATGASLNAQNTWYPDTILPKLEQQVTETAELGLSVDPASLAETLGLVVAISIIMLVMGYLKTKNILDSIIYNILLYIFVPLISSILWVLYHIARYGASDTSLISVFLFGLISSISIVYLRSIIFAIVYHDINNLIKKLFCFKTSVEGTCTGGLFATDSLILTIVLIEIILILIFVYLFITIYFKEENKGKSETSLNII